MGKQGETEQETGKKKSGCQVEEVETSLAGGGVSGWGRGALSPWETEFCRNVLALQPELSCYADWRAWIISELQGPWVPWVQ